METTCFPVRFYLNVYKTKAQFVIPLENPRPSLRLGPLGALSSPPVTTQCPIHVTSSYVNTWEETAHETSHPSGLNQSNAAKNTIMYHLNALKQLTRGQQRAGELSYCCRGSVLSLNNFPFFFYLPQILPRKVILLPSSHQRPAPPPPPASPLV